MITSNSNTDFVSLKWASGLSAEDLVENQIFATWLKDYLSKNTVGITFVKKDGTDRFMNCTRNLELIPEERKPIGNVVQKPSTVIKAFDLDIQEWRSFNTSTIKRFDWEKKLFE